MDCFCYAFVVRCVVVLFVLFVYGALYLSFWFCFIGWRWFVLLVFVSGVGFIVGLFGFGILWFMFCLGCGLCVC